MFCILRARGGSSVKEFRKSLYGDVFSAHAEVVPCAAILYYLGKGILRARGGSSVETHRW